MPLKLKPLDTWQVHKTGTPVDIEWKRLLKKFPSLAPSKLYDLAKKNIADKNKKPTGKLTPTGKLMPKGKLSPASPKNVIEDVNVSAPEEKKGINIYLILAAAAALYYFMFKKKR